MNGLPNLSRLAAGGDEERQQREGAPILANVPKTCDRIGLFEETRGVQSYYFFLIGWPFRVTQLVVLLLVILLYSLCAVATDVVLTTLAVNASVLLLALLVTVVYEYFTWDTRLASRPREERLENGPVRMLFHQTANENASKIMDSATLFAGKTGMVGGGIYFATTKAHTKHKALTKGVILTCCVQLGRIKRVPFAGDRTITAKSMADEGYDSVLLLRQNGHEYVVYKSDQVRILSFEYAD